MQVLGVSLFLSLALQTGMRFGQLSISPWVGGLADRLGNRPVMMVSQLLVAAGLLFFAAATPEHWTWFVGAWVLWIAYAGLNVCLPNLMLKLSPERVQHAVHRRVLRGHRAVLCRQHDRRRGAGRPVWQVGIPAGRRPLAGFLSLPFPLRLGGTQPGAAGVAVGNRADDETGQRVRTLVFCQNGRFLTAEAGEYPTQ